ncbi:hypothetical protein RJ639_008307 [Escallonia herrerae]|uniref:Uncharacterized protein n=1 Tax=Escallonia herrerae TaxID=1293975 RepID=A0AA88VSY6_9ASTE|nr:hypothetical protein RJ639_008307 [Escallonia herrerae]
MEHSSRLRVPEPKRYGGARDAKELENFLFDVEQYFRAIRVDLEETMVLMATMESDWGKTQGQALRKKGDVPGKGLMYVDIKVNGKAIMAMVDTGATHNYISSAEMERLGLTLEKVCEQMVDDAGAIGADNSACPLPPRPPKRKKETSSREPSEVWDHFQKIKGNTPAEPDPEIAIYKATGSTTSSSSDACASIVIENIDYMLVELLIPFHLLPCFVLARNHGSAKIMTVVLSGSMVVGLIRNGCLEEGRWVLVVMRCKNPVFWNAMIGGYAENYRMEEARALFDEIGERNAVTWTSLVAGHCRQNFDIKATRETCVSLLYACTGHAIWGALLDVCGFGEAELGVARSAAKWLLELDPLNALAHMVLCNMYAATGQHGD